MKRFGATQPRNEHTGQEEALLLRLHLLIVMVKAALKGYPAGVYRKKAVLDTATTVYKIISKSHLSILNLDKSTLHILKERVKLLSVMAVAITNEEYPLGVHRREAVLDNIDRIRQIVFPNAALKLFPEVLKVA